MNAICNLYTGCLMCRFQVGLSVAFRIASILHVIDSTSFRKHSSRYVGPILPHAILDWDLVTEKPIWEYIQITFRPHSDAQQDILTMLTCLHELSYVIIRLDICKELNKYT